MNNIVEYNGIKYAVMELKNSNIELSHNIDLFNGNLYSVLIESSNINYISNLSNFNSSNIDCLLLIRQ